MSITARLIAAFAAALILTGARPIQPLNERSVHQRMAAAGFIPLDEMTFGGRDVRRVLTADPYGMLPIPGIELEHHSDGRRTLRLQYRGWVGRAYDLSPEEWEHVSHLEAGAYAPPEKNSVTLGRGVVVHCWSGLLEASPDGATSWWGCNDGTRRAQAYSEAVIALAIQKMDCPPSDEETLWRFSECAARSYKLDDPALGVKFKELQERWQKQRERGPDILANARRALTAARANRTDDLVIAARDAVFAFGHQQEALRAILQTGFYPFREAEEGGGGSAEILADTRRAWIQDLNAQDRNYIDLLEGLARIQGAKPLGQG